MTGQDLAFYSMIVITVVLFLKWLNLKNKQGGGVTKIKLPGGVNLRGNDIKDVLRELTEEPTVKEEIDLDQKFVDKFESLNEIKREIGDKLKGVTRESDDLWEEIREFYKIGDYNLSLSDDRKKLLVKNPTTIEKTLSSFLRR
jgi:hypothetical protein